MKIVKNEDVDIKKWNALLFESDYSSAFQTFEFYTFYNSSNNYESDVFAVEKNNKYTSLMVVTVQKERGLKSFFSRRGIVYGGPLITNNSQSLSELLNYVKNYYRKKLIYLEIRNHFDFSSCSESFIKNSFKYFPHMNVQLSLEKSNDLELIISKMKYNRRREVRQTYSQGVESGEALNEKEVKDLYKILKDLYQNRVKLPLNSYSFFLDLYKSDIGKVFVVRHKEKIIGGSFCIYYKNMSIYTLYYAGLRGYYKKIFPTHLAVLEAIKFAINNNLQMVDFMGAGKPDEDYGVRKYKLQFGGDLVSHGRYKLILNTFLFKLGELGLKFLSKF